MENRFCISGVARTLAEIIGIDAPEKAGPALEPLMSLAREKNVCNAERVLIYNPDAVALWIYRKYSEIFTGAAKVSALQLPLLSVMPSVTPVCFASMYSGAQPKVHGILKYEKPVLAIDTLFDALIRAGKQPAIIATEKCSIATIFLNRNLDYFIYKTPEECNLCAERLIKADKHDFITVYNGNYDSTMHKHGPESKKSLKELRKNTDAYCALHSLSEKYWSHRTRLTGFCPDHGCHEISAGLGSHGLDMDEDMNVIHFYDLKKGE